MRQGDLVGPTLRDGTCVGWGTRNFVTLTQEQPQVSALRSDEAGTPVEITFLSY